MSKSDELINAYFTALSAKDEAREQEESMVLNCMRTGFNTLLKDWLGAFADELSIHFEHEFSFNPEQTNWPAQAQLKAFFSWRNIEGAITYGICKADEHKSRDLTPRAAMIVEFGIRRYSWGKHKLPVGFQLDLKMASLTPEQFGWVFPSKGAAVSDEKLTDFLLRILGEKQARDANEKLEEQIALGQQLDRMKKAIRATESYAELEPVLEKALREYPDQAAEWHNLATEMRAHFDDMEDARAKHLLEVEQIREWMLDWFAVLDTNRATLKAIQDGYLGLFNVYRMKYGVVALDDEGNKFIETRDVYVLGADSFTAGATFHAIPADAKDPARDLIIFHPVTAELLEFDIVTAPGDLVRRTWVKVAYQSLNIPVLVDPVTYLVELGDATWQQYPALEPWMIGHAGWPDVLRQVLEKYADDGNYFDIYKAVKDLFEQIQPAAEDTDDEFPF